MIQFDVGHLARVLCAVLYTDQILPSVTPLLGTTVSNIDILVERLAGPAQRIGLLQTVPIIRCMLLSVSLLSVCGTALGKVSPILLSCLPSTIGTCE